MKAKLTLLFLLILLPLCAHSQQNWQWAKRGGSTSRQPNFTPFKEPVIDMATDPNGNIYMVANVGGENLNVDGTSLNFHFPGDLYDNIIRTNPGGLLMSYDCDGNFRWSKLYSGSYEGIAGVATDTLGNVYVSAYTSRFATKSLFGVEYPVYFDNDTIIPYSASLREYKESNFMIQYDTLGNMKRFHSPQSRNVHIYESTRTVGIWDLFVSPNGIQHYFTRADNFEYNGIIYRPVVEGDTLQKGEYVLKYDVQGNYLGNIKLDLQLQTEYSNYTKLKINHDPVRKVYYMTGYCKIPTSGNYRDSLWIGGQLVDNPMFAAKFDSIGNSVWLKQGVNKSGVFAEKPEIDDQGNIYLAGTMSASGNPSGTATFNGYTGQNNIQPLSGFPVLIKMKANGDLIWGTNASTNAGARGENFVRKGDHIYFADSHGGITWGNYSFPPVPNSGYDMYLAQFDKETGAIISMDTIGSNHGYSEYPTAMASDKRGNVYIGGEFQGKMYVGNDTIANIHSGGAGTDYFLVKSGQANCNCPLPEATYSHNGSNGTVQFNYTGSANYDRLEWEFGDGTLQTTTTGTVNHSFADNIEYWVCVTAYDDSCGHDTWCTWVEPYKLSTETLPADSFSYYPNPVDDILNIVTKEAMAYTLFDLSGKTMGSGNLKQGGNSLDTSALPSGFYMLRITDTNGARRVVKVVKR